MHGDVPSLLVVDDDSKIRNLVASYLRSEGYDVEVASDGKEAIEAVRRLQPDLGHASPDEHPCGQSTRSSRRSTRTRVGGEELDIFTKSVGRRDGIWLGLLVSVGHG